MKTALLRREWKSKRAIQYSIIANYKESKDIAPNSVRELLDNGLSLYENGLIKK